MLSRDISLCVVSAHPHLAGHTHATVLPERHNVSGPRLYKALDTPPGDGFVNDSTRRRYVTLCLFHLRRFNLED